MMRFALALVLLATAVLPAAANSPRPTLPPGENLLSAIPLGWKLSARSSGNIDRLIELVTENQSAANWTRLIAVEIRRDGTSLSEYERTETNTFRAACSDAQIYPRDPVTVSGLPASRFFARAKQCAGSTQPESALFLAVQGKDALYAIQLAWRPYPPTENELQAALAYLATVRVCDTRAGSCQREQQEADAGATTVAADQTAVWQKTMDDARGALRAHRPWSSATRRSGPRRPWSRPHLPPAALSGSSRPACRTPGPWRGTPTLPGARSPSADRDAKQAGSRTARPCLGRPGRGRSRAESSPRTAWPARRIGWPGVR